MLLLELGDLGDASGVAAALECGGEKDVDDLVGEALADDAGADRQHVGVVVLSGQARRVQAVAERRPNASHRVGSQLLALPGAADHDPEVGIAVADRPGGGGAERRVVDALGRVGAMVDDLEAGGSEPLDQMLLELVAGMVGAERDASSSGRVSSGRV